MYAIRLQLRLRRIHKTLLCAALACVLAAPLMSQTDPRLASETSEVLADWVQIGSQEWVKGKFHGMYDREIEFDSSEFDVHTWDWDDILQLRTRDPVEIGLITGETLVAIAANGMALAKSASSSRTVGDLPPNSSVMRFMVSTAPRAIDLPTAVEPVNEILAMPGWRTISAPTVSPRPVTILKNPGGTSARSKTRVSRSVWRALS